jgi:hypothetical protein
VTPPVMSSVIYGLVVALWMPVLVAELIDGGKTR